jgi:carbon monoxide dehydrogenase subunit G
MLVKDSFTVQAPVEVVWALFEDVPRISGCMPGVDAVKQTAPDAYQGTLSRVGPISAAFGAWFALRSACLGANGRW